MTVLIQIIASCCAFYGFYMIICAVRSIWGERTLLENDCVITDDEIVIFADHGKLEYLLRAAEAERNLLSKRIEVKLSAEDEDFAENIFIAKAFCLKHKNIVISII